MTGILWQQLPIMAALTTFLQLCDACIFQLGNVDTSRVASRMGDSQYVNILNMLLLTLPGTPMVYYGEEIGMKDVTLNSTNCEDKVLQQLYCTY